MDIALEVALVLAVGLLLANLPFVNERLFVVGPRRKAISHLFQPARVACGIIRRGLQVGQARAGIGQRHARSDS